jgi:F420-dependent oxidoreductase-like protein
VLEFMNDTDLETRADTRQRVRLGLQVAQFGFPGGTAAIGPSLAATARQAEEASFASLWTVDHFYQLFGTVEDPMLESYLALAFAAGVTDRIKLGVMVTGVTYRHPAVLIKMVTSLDVLSGGRAYLGLGAAWLEREHAAMGVPFPPTAERFERLEETLQIAHQMWSGENRPYQGKHYRLTEMLNAPPPLTKPHPPILIGGGGEQKTLRLVARYGDACNLGVEVVNQEVFAFADNLDRIRHKLDVLRGHCDTIGRPYADIEKTTMGLPNVTRHGSRDSITPTEAIERIGQLAELGIDQQLIGMPAHDPAAFELLATEVVPEAIKLPVAGR